MNKPIPEGYSTVTPTFTFKDTAKAIEFYKKAFGAELRGIVSNPSGQGTMHAETRVGNSILMMADEMFGGEHCAKSAETLGSSPISLYVYVPNVDEAFDQAVRAGGTPVMPVADMFWGDRVGQIKDPFGYSWTIATRQQDVTPEQLRKGAETFAAQMP
jgi:uncharacterized glyoxalase superfamily protein PhnB